MVSYYVARITHAEIWLNELCFSGKRNFVGGSLYFDWRLLVTLTFRERNAFVGLWNSVCLSRPWKMAQVVRCGRAVYTTKSTPALLMPRPRKKSVHQERVDLGFAKLSDFGTGQVNFTRSLPNDTNKLAFPSVTLEGPCVMLCKRCRRHSRKIE